MSTIENIENPHAYIDALLEAKQIAMVSRFVPASAATSDAGDWRAKSINFIVTVTCGPRELYHGPYSYGVGCLPGYSQNWATKICGDAFVRDAIENGVWPKKGLMAFERGGSPLSWGHPKVPAPNMRDVMHSLLSDASAVDNSSFEEWCADYGYDPDSRAAFKTYETCRDIGLRMRAALGDETLNALRNAFQDY